MNRKQPQPTRALFIGRFQPFHKGHEKAVRLLLKKYDEVIIAIGSAENAITMENPFTAGERTEMIRSCFKKNGLARLLIVPIRDVNNHATWVEHVLSYLPHFDVVYSNNGLVRELFTEAEISAQGMDFHCKESYTGEIIRKKILLGKEKEWQKSVPKTVLAIMKKLNIKKRLDAAL